MATVLAKEVAESHTRRRVFTRYVTLVKDRGRIVAEFRGSERAKPHLRVGVDRETFEEFLWQLNFTKEEGKEGFEAIFSTENDWAFEIAAFFAVIMRTLKKDERKAKKNKIIRALLNTHPFEFTFWNYQLSKARDRYAQDRVARAFLVLQGLR
ncbi:hypothetical protein [Archaeoglobus sp.]|uniref:hypothetical protein n=1 Tax=Archaeoglobus sp. TaxID=1872626 RepID=UPI0024AB4BDA|nr:hypothetical protein [Archaeoglobus sp.]MDI3498155.1 hypothetical protein [Archaeoglobus sp.]